MTTPTTTTPRPTFLLRDARPSDCTAIYQMIYDLALYEKMPEKVAITVDRLMEDGFGPGHAPRFHALVIQRLSPDDTEAETVGYSIYNTVYSSFTGSHLWVEDIFLAEPYRSQYGLAGAIMRKLATAAQREKMSHIEWNVLGWNQLAIGFYQSVGALDISTGETGAHLFRLTEDRYSELLQTPLEGRECIHIE